MQINPETLKKLRKTKGFSQQTLADASGVAKKTIARIETGKGEPRGATVQELAKALRVKPEVLAQKSESDAVRDEFRQIKLYLHSETVLAYDLVKDRYGVDMRSIVDAAPMLFTLLAEMSLADRRRRFENLETALRTFPEHIINRGLGTLASERYSIAQRDIFACSIDDHDADPEYFEDSRSPFLDFLIGQAESLGPDNDAINHEDIQQYGNFDDLPSFSLFETFLKSLTDGSSRADFALSHGYVRLGQIPEELLGEDVTSERVKWLEAQVPDDDWAEHERLTASIENSNRSITNEPPSEGGAEDA